MKTDKELKENNPELYKVARQGGTERPHSSDLLHIDKKGVFHCAICDASLFSSDTQFDSGSGWPSFTDPINHDSVKLTADHSHGMHRTEVRCANCDAHLGHVFPDGPKRKEKDSGALGRHDRYCTNGICLDLQNN